MSQPIQYIQGQWQAGNGDTFSSVNPANGDVIWQGQGADALQVDLAVKTARQAFIAWSQQPLAQRLTVVQAFAELLKQQTETMALCIAEETGKALWESRTEVAAMIGKIAISIKAYEERKNLFTKDLNSDIDKQLQKN